MTPYQMWLALMTAIFAKRAIVEAVQDAKDKRAWMASLSAEEIVALNEQKRLCEVQKEKDRAASYRRRKIYFWVFLGLFLFLIYIAPLLMPKD